MEVKRKISYVPDNEDLLEQEAKIAAKMTMEQRLRNYLQLIRANYAAAGINIDDLKVTRVIKYVESDQE